VYYLTSKLSMMEEQHEINGCLTGNGDIGSYERNIFKLLLLEYTPTTK